MITRTQSGGNVPLNALATGWVRIGDLTDDMIRAIESAQRREAAAEGRLTEWDREYRRRMRRMEREERLYGSR
jgi:hypothetical protein